MSTGPLSYRQSVFKRQQSKSFTRKMAAKTTWHRYGTKLRHCHPVYYYAGRVDGGKRKISVQRRSVGRSVGVCVCPIEHILKVTQQAGLCIESRYSC